MGKGSVPWIHAIRTRLFLGFALLAALLTLVLSFWIERETRRHLENELTAKLHAVGGSAAAALRPAIVPALLSFGPSQKSLRTYRDALRELTDLQSRTEVRRIFLASLEGRTYVDTDARMSIGDLLPTLGTNSAVMKEARAGRPADGPLFTEEDGEIRKTGYVPIELNDEVIAIIGVEADAEFLGAVRSLRDRILWVGGIGLGLALALAFVFARGLTRPLEGLVDWARYPASGDLTRVVPQSGKDEIGRLAETLETMRGHLELQDRELRAMVSGVAHEIRNPLGGMQLYAEMMQRDKAMTEKQRDRTGKILSELDQLRRIVEEFLDYARPAQPVPEPVAIPEFMSELLSLFEPEAAVKSIELGSDLEPELVADVDPTHLRQILRNLIGNAIQAVPEGGAVVVRGRAVDDGLVLEVEDNGPGIDAETKERIFEPFFTTKIKGAGLGLPIVRRLVLLNLGRVELEDAEGGGARFRIFLPSRGTETSNPLPTSEPTK